MTEREAIAYLSGVLHGDAWLTRELGLRCADRDFADAFVAALTITYGVNRPAKLDERGYWLVRRSNVTGRFDGLRTFAPLGRSERAHWVRGLFDSEGNANIHRVKGGPNCWVRRIAMYSTAIDTLQRAKSYLDELDLPTYLRSTKNSATHKGTKVVYELSLRASVANYARFRDVVGTSISRKRVTMDEIVASYKPDLSAHCREAQRRGAATKTRRVLEQTIPSVIAAIRSRLDDGLPVTLQACSKIVGYATARGHLKHSELVAAARGGVSSGH